MYNSHLPNLSVVIHLTLHLCEKVLLVFKLSQHQLQTQQMLQDLIMTGAGATQQTIVLWVGASANTPTVNNLKHVLAFIITQNISCVREIISRFL